MFKGIKNFIAWYHPNIKVWFKSYLQFHHIWFSRADYEKTAKDIYKCMICGHKEWPTDHGDYLENQDCLCPDCASWAQTINLYKNRHFNNTQETY